MYVTLIVNAREAWLTFEHDVRAILTNIVTRVAPPQIAEDLFDICWHQATGSLAYLDSDIAPIELLHGPHADGLLGDLMYDDLFEYLIESEYIVAITDTHLWDTVPIDELARRTIVLGRELLHHTVMALKNSNAAPTFFDPQPRTDRTMVTRADPHVLLERYHDYAVRCELMIPRHL